MYTSKDWERRFRTEAASEAIDIHHPSSRKRRWASRFPRSSTPTASRNIMREHPAVRTTLTDVFA